MKCRFPSVEHTLPLIGCGAGPALLGALNLAAAPLAWHWRNPLPQGNTLNATAYGAQTYVAVGDAGAIIISPDGTNWVEAGKHGVRGFLIPLDIKHHTSAG